MYFSNSLVKTPNSATDHSKFLKYISYETSNNCLSLTSV